MIYLFNEMSSVIVHRHAFQTAPILYLAIVVADVHQVIVEVHPLVLVSSKQLQKIKLVKILMNVQKGVICVIEMPSA